MYLVSNQIILCIQKKKKILFMILNKVISSYLYLLFSKNTFYSYSLQPNSVNINGIMYSH